MFDDVLDAPLQLQMYASYIFTTWYRVSNFCQGSKGIRGNRGKRGRRGPRGPPGSTGPVDVRVFLYEYL